MSLPQTNPFYTDLNKASNTNQTTRSSPQFNNLRTFPNDELHDDEEKKDETVPLQQHESSSTNIDNPPSEIEIALQKERNKKKTTIS